LLGRGLRRLGDAVRDEVHDIEARHALALQEVHRVRILFAEDGDQDVGACDFLLARRLDVQDRALDHALETERRLGVDLLAAIDNVGVCSLMNAASSLRRSSMLRRRRAGLRPPTDCPAARAADARR
jgi:hypothetical protein